MKIKKILMFYPSMEKLYKKAIVRASVPYYIPLGLLTIATPLIEKGYDVKLVDLNFYSNIQKTIKNKILKEKPDIVVLSFNTPLYSQSLNIAKIAKEIDPKIKIIAGGAHVTFDYESTLKNSKIDIAVLGEADFKLLEIIDNLNNKIPLTDVKGIAYKRGFSIVANSRGKFIKDLDVIPFPAIELIDIKKYKIPHTYCRKNPIFTLEMSRGCVFGCIYCNKTIFGKTFRRKSPERVIEDLKRAKKLGFKEIHVMDDCFSTNLKWAKTICRMIIKEKELKGLILNCNIGLRANQVDLELFKLMKKAGFYRVAFGVESGSQKILDNIKKEMELKDYVRAFKLAKKADIETMGYFMIGSPGETPKDVYKTMRFVKKIKPDYVKYSLVIPLPNTPLFDKWQKSGHIKSLDWDSYSYYSETKVYDHPNMSWDTMYTLLKKAYRDFYLSPRFILNRIYLSIKNKTLFDDIKMFFTTIKELF